MTAHRLCLIHPIDPRSNASGLAARLARIMARRPDDFSILLVGVDECGDLALGERTVLDVEGRSFDFLPVLRARRSGWSRGGDADRTLRLAFRLALLHRLPTLRCRTRAERSSIELHDFAWAPFARLLGHPVIQVVQPTCVAEMPPAGGISEYLALRLASRIVGDEDAIHRLRDGGASVAAKTEVLRLAENPVDSDGMPLCTEAQIQRLYERHRRLFRIGRADAVRAAVA